MIMYFQRGVTKGGFHFPGFSWAPRQPFFRVQNILMCDFEVER